MIQELFPTYFLKEKLGVTKSKISLLDKSARHLPEVDAAGVAWSKKNYVHGYTSYGSLSQLYSQFSVFDELRKRIDRSAIKFLKKMGVSGKGKKLVMNTMWVNVMSEETYHAFHRHPGSVISGTYYVNAPKGSGPFRIEDPRAPLFMNTPERKIQFDIEPKADTLILFESWLLHEVPPHRGKDPRISISFNYSLVD